MLFLFDLVSKCIQQLLKKAGTIFYFFIHSLVKQNETQGAFSNMINILRVTKCFET